jgi:peptide/nickel transport system substrate-binding protein
MRFTVLRRSARTRTALVALAAIALAGMEQSTRGAGKPVYGGVLRVELRATAIQLNPAKWKPGAVDFAANERLAGLVFDRLVTLDRYGRFQPQLATEWTHDPAAKRWQFTLRPGVKFSDGTPLTPADVAAALQPLLPRGMQISAAANGVAIHSASGFAEMLEMLSSGPYFVYKDSGAGLVGSGPFVLEKKPADGKAGTEHLRFRFRDECWSGRPYLDAIDVALGVPPLKALLDLQLGNADVGELSEETAKRAASATVRLWESAPVTLYALKFAAPAKTENERTVRLALRLAVDRNAMARVLLQKQAEPAGALLPQWLSGYAFLFAAESDAEQARQLRASLPTDAAGMAKPVRLAFDGNQELARLIAERVAVNARAAGLTLQIAARSKLAGSAASEGASTHPEPDAQIVVWRYASLSANDELAAVTAEWKLTGGEAGALADSDTRYAWEKRMLDDNNVIPLVTLPDFAVIDARVRNWSPEPWGEWRLAEVWLEAPERARSTDNQAGARP